jgi:hypothetical protein
MVPWRGRRPFDPSGYRLLLPCYSPKPFPIIWSPPGDIELPRIRAETPQIRTLIRTPFPITNCRVQSRTEKHTEGKRETDVAVGIELLADTNSRFNFQFTPVFVDNRDPQV